MRDLFADLGLTIAYSLLASLIVAMTLVPSMSARVLKKMPEKKRADRAFDRFAGAYENLWRFCCAASSSCLASAWRCLSFARVASCVWA
jgi:multidrug efflux pump subunit AcrB